LVGYEFMLDKQKRNFDKDFTEVNDKLEKLEEQNFRLKMKLIK
jgi:hypothetical protein